MNYVEKNVRFKLIFLEKTILSGTNTNTEKNMNVSESSSLYYEVHA